MRASKYVSLSYTSTCSVGGSLRIYGTQGYIQLGKGIPEILVVARSIALFEKGMEWPREKTILEEKAMAIRRCPDDIRDFLVSRACLSCDVSC